MVGRLGQRNVRGLFIIVVVSGAGLGLAVFRQPARTPVASASLPARTDKDVPGAMAGGPGCNPGGAEPARSLP